jgi:hypothetical protein
MYVRNRHRTSALVAAIASGLLLGFAAPVSTADDHEDKAKYTDWFSAKAYSIASSRTQTFKVEIGIERYSTDDERQALLGKIMEGATEGATQALRESEEIGFIRFGSEYQSIRYAKSFPDGEKRKIVIATDRPLGAVEVTRSLRSRDYTVSVGMLEVNEKGKGSGEFAPHCEISYNEETKRLDVGTQNTQPFRLTAVRKR